MSWVPRWSSWGGRLSPFTRSPHSGAAKISDEDFSYITNDDLRRHQQEGGVVSDGIEEDYGPPRDTDVLVLKNRTKDFHVHFPAYSIAKGDLIVAQVRDAAARKVNINDSRAIKLVYKGKNLKDDSRTCKSEGLRDGSELMCSITNGMPSSSTTSDDDEDEEGDDGDDGPDGMVAGGNGRKKKNKRGGKKAQKRKQRDAATAAGQNLNVPTSQSSTRAPSPATKPTTPHGKLDVIQEAMNSYLPECQRFIQSPPSESSKRDFDHKRLAETILTKVVMQLDGVETEGDEDARARRKAMIKEAQGLLSELDAAMAK